jgi:uncharacterized membrane protein
MTLRFLALLAFLAVLVAAAQPAAAQSATLTSSVSPQGRYSLGPGEEKTFTWTIVAAGATAASVQVTPTISMPDGWTVQADLATFTLGGPNGQTSRPIEVRIAIPPDAVDVADGEMKLRATGQTAAGAAAPTEQTVFLSYVAPIVPPAPVPPDYTWAWVSGIVTALILVAVVVYLLQARRVRLAIDSPIKRFNIGTGGAYKVTVTNPSRVAQNVQLRIQHLPKEWSAAFSFPVVPLNGGERSEVPLWVNVPVDAVPNKRQPFRIQARPNGFSPWLVTRKLEVTTLDVEIVAKPV